MPLPPPPAIATDAKLALFLDVDGTLLEIAATPHAVVVPEALKHTLNSLSSRFDGALALVSGRSVRVLDELFAPFHFPAAGIHGCERRDATGHIVRPHIDTASFARERDELTRWTHSRPGTLLEDKGYALALHYRQAPQYEAEALAAVESALVRLDRHELQRGKFVYEVRPAGYSKGGAVEAFMRETPFRGRTPLFVGDDVTDEAGFIVVNQLSGISIRVGEAATTAARHRLAGVDEAVTWLEALASRR